MSLFRRFAASAVFFVLLAGLYHLIQKPHKTLLDRVVINVACIALAAVGGGLTYVFVGATASLINAGLDLQGVVILAVLLLCALAFFALAIGAYSWYRKKTPITKATK